MRLINRIISFILIVAGIGFTLVSCNDEDDIDIFVDRTWKVSNFFGPAGPVYTKTDDLNVLNQENCFYIRFESSSKFTGRTLNKEFSGTWSVNLKERTISLRLNGTIAPTDAISRQFIKSLNEAILYRGDYNYLNLVDEDKAYILFHPYELEI